MRYWLVAFGSMGCVSLAGCATSTGGVESAAAGTDSGGQAGAPGHDESTGGSRASATGGKTASGGSGTGGSVSSTGGAVATGGQGAGGHSATGGSGNTGAGGSTPYVPPDCGSAGAAPWPSNAPALKTGTWTDIAPIPNFYSNGLVFNACDPAVLYTVGGNYPASGGPGDTLGVFRSTDAGTTWKKVNSIDSGARPRIDPRDPRHLYVIDGVNGSTQGFWRSTDAGEHWEIPEGFKTAATSVNDWDCYDVDPDPADFNHVLVTFHWYWHSCADFGFGGCTSGVLESTDGGDSWTIHNPDPRWATAGGYGVHFLYDPALGVGDPKTWLFGSQGKGYYRTTDSGATWTKVTDVSMAHGGSQIYYASRDALYLSGERIQKSTDNGATWTPIAPFNYYLSVMGDGTRLYSGAGGGPKFVTATLANDTTWTDFNQQTFKGGPYEMTFDAARGIMYSANAQGGLWAMKVK